MYGYANFIFTYGGSMYQQPYNATQTHSTLCKLYVKEPYHVL